MIYPIYTQWQNNITIKTAILATTLFATSIARIALATIFAVATVITAGTYRPFRNFAANQFELGCKEAAVVVGALAIFIHSFRAQPKIEIRPADIVQVPAKPPSVLFDSSLLKDGVTIISRQLLVVETTVRDKAPGLTLKRDYQSVDQSLIDQACQQIREAEAQQLEELNRLRDQAAVTAEEWLKSNDFFKNLSLEQVQEIVFQTTIAKQQTGMEDHTQLNQCLALPRGNLHLLQNPQEFTSQYTSSIASTIGKRKQMEDAFDGTRITLKQDGKEHCVLFTAVLDGHNGQGAVRCVFANIVNVFSTYLKHEKEITMQSIMHSLDQTCEYLHQETVA